VRKPHSLLSELVRSAAVLVEFFFSGQYSSRSPRALAYHGAHTSFSFSHHECVLSTVPGVGFRRGLLLLCCCVPVVCCRTNVKFFVLLSHNNRDACCGPHTRSVRCQFNPTLTRNHTGEVWRRRRDDVGCRDERHAVRKPHTAVGSLQLPWAFSSCCGDELTVPAGARVSRRAAHVFLLFLSHHECVLSIVPGVGFRRPCCAFACSSRTRTCERARRLESDFFSQRDDDDGISVPHTSAAVPVMILLESFFLFFF